MEFHWMADEGDDEEKASYDSSPTASIETQPDQSGDWPQMMEDSVPRDPGDARVAGGVGTTHVRTPSPAKRVDLADERRRRQLKEASQRCRSRQKLESVMYTTQISEVRSEIATLTAQLSAPTSPNSRRTREIAEQHVKLQRRIDFLSDKLEQHRKWLDELRNLMLAAPLLDFVAGQTPDLFSTDASQVQTQGERSEGDNDDTEAKGTCADGIHCPEPPLPPSKLATHSSDLIERLDAWRAGSTGKKFSNFAMNKRIADLVRLSYANARKLLNEFTSDYCQFQLHFFSRGWAFAASTQEELLVFRGQRMIPHAASRDIAMIFWQSLQLEDIVRTFLPVVQDSSLVYEGDSCSLSRRMMQFSPSNYSRMMITVESILEQPDTTDAWQISIDTCHDSSLKMLATETGAAEPSSPWQSLSSSIQQQGESIFIQDFVIGVSCRQFNGGVYVEFVGSAHHNGPCNRGIHEQLVQYLVSYLPVFEDVQLQAKASPTTTSPPIQTFDCDVNIARSERLR